MLSEIANKIASAMSNLLLTVVVSLLHRAHIIKLPVEPLHHTLNHYGMSEVKIVSSYLGFIVLLCILGILLKMYLF